MVVELCEEEVHGEELVGGLEGGKGRSGFG